MDNRMMMLDVDKMMDTIQEEVEVETSSSKDFHCENSMDNLELLEVESVYDDGKLVLSIIEKHQDDEAKEIGDKQTLLVEKIQRKQKKKQKKQKKEKVVGAVGHTRKKKKCKSDLHFLRKHKVVAMVYSDHDPNGDSEKNYMLQAARRSYNHHHFGGEALSNGVSSSQSDSSQSLPAPNLAPEAPAFNDLNSTHVPAVHSQVEGVRNESLTFSHGSTTMSRYPAGFERMRMRISTPDSDCCIID